MTLCAIILFFPLGLFALIHYMRALSAYGTFHLFYDLWLDNFIRSTLVVKNGQNDRCQNGYQNGVDMSTGVHLLHVHVHLTIRWDFKMTDHVKSLETDRANKLSKKTDLAKFIYRNKAPENVIEINVQIKFLDSLLCLNVPFSASGNSLRSSSF